MSNRQFTDDVSLYENISKHISKIKDKVYLFFDEIQEVKEDVAGKKVLSVNEKYYVVDHGIREAVYGNNERDINQVLENIICIELQKS